MAEKYFLGKASKVAQITKVTVGGTLSGETFVISVGGVAIASHTDSTTDIADTVAGLVSAWSASTHAYATCVVSTAVSPDVVLTSNAIGMPFEITINAPGGSATFVKNVTTANSGPNVLDLADNWNGNALPSASDNLHFASRHSVLWNLTGLALTYGDITFYQDAVNAKFGLDWKSFTTAANGGSVNSTVAEYRDTNLVLKSNGTIRIGKQRIASSGPSRLCLDVSTVACLVEVIQTGISSSENGRPNVRLLANNAATDVYVRAATTGVGVASDVPGETSVCNDIVVAGDSNCKVTVGPGVTYNKFEQSQGASIVSSAVTLADCNVYAGTCMLEGEFVVTDLKVRGTGVCYSNNTKTAADVIGTATLESGGKLNMLKSREARAVNVVKLETLDQLLHDSDVVTISTITVLAGGKSS